MIWTLELGPLLAVDLCICFHHLLDEFSMMTIKVVINSNTGQDHACDKMDPGMVLSSSPDLDVNMALGTQPRKIEEDGSYEDLALYCWYSSSWQLGWEKKKRFDSDPLLNLVAPCLEAQGTVHQYEVSILNICAPNIKPPNYGKETLPELKTDIKPYTPIVQEGEHPNRLDPKNPVYAEETSPSVIVNGFSERLQASHIQRIRPLSENLAGTHARSVPVQLALALVLCGAAVDKAKYGAQGMGPLESHWNLCKCHANAMRWEPMKAGLLISGHYQQVIHALQQTYIRILGPVLTKVL
ncbi:hypothetical protein U0070_011652, partial [Myodes glareolus]